MSLYDIMILLGKGSKSAGNVNVLSRTFAPVLESLDPSKTMIEKLTIGMEGTRVEIESKLKYLL